MIRAAVAFSFVVAVAAMSPALGQAQPPEECLKPGAALDPACLPDGTAGQFHRQVCAYMWVDGTCELTRWPDPRYATDADPHPDDPLRYLVGAVHEHSSYSDGDPGRRPLDYFAAGRTGHNVADRGGDTGVKLDFMMSSEHSDNSQIPITTAAVCADPSSPKFLAGCWHATDNDHYWKWPATLQQARQGSDSRFTAMRGFEWTNDYYNHLNVFLSTNFVNVKIDGSYTSMDFFWNWLREPVAEGGGADGLVTFNHPGGDPHLTPFDDGMPHTEVLAQIPGGANWNDLAHVPDVDDNVAGIEVNRDDDIEWYVRALERGWHVGPVAAEDEHQREWSTSRDGKTVLFARGRSPRDYYWALKNHRTIAIRDPLVDGRPGEDVVVPTIHFFADAADINDPKAALLGSTVKGGTHVLRVEATGLPAGSRVALISKAGGLKSPIDLGAAKANGGIAATRPVRAPKSGEDWYFVVVCHPGGKARCGTDTWYGAVTAPIWVAAD